MKYTQEQLGQIRDLASICTKPSEIAVILDVRVEVLKSDIAMPGSPARDAYMKGKVSTRTEVRRQIVALARVGSPLALEMTEKALLDMDDDE